METSQPLGEPQTPHVPFLLLRNVFEEEVWVQAGACPSNIENQCINCLLEPGRLCCTSPAKGRMFRLSNPTYEPNSR